MACVKNVILDVIKRCFAFPFFEKRPDPLFDSRAVGINFRCITRHTYTVS